MIVGICGADPQKFLLFQVLFELANGIKGSVVISVDHPGAVDQGVNDVPVKELFTFGCVYYNRGKTTVLYGGGICRHADPVQAAAEHDLIAKGECSQAEHSQQQYDGKRTRTSAEALAEAGYFAPGDPEDLIHRFLTISYCSASILIGHCL